MDTLATASRTLEIIRSHGFSFSKKYGQNFLIDPGVPDRIAAAAQITQEDCVLEIGPGIGTLTRVLAGAAGKVVAVEIDNSLIPILDETLKDCPNVTVLNRDIMKTDLRSLAEEYHKGKALKVVANLPYYITTPILMALLNGDAPIASITVMVQKEVALRMQAGPGTKDYGALSLAVQYHSLPKIVANVPPNCFLPRPEVASAVIHLDLTKRPLLPPVDEKLLFTVIRAAFGQRRKTLANALKNAPDVPFSREEIVSALSDLDLPENIRGEALTLEQFALLCGRLDTAK